MLLVRAEVEIINLSQGIAPSIKNRMAALEQETGEVGGGNLILADGIHAEFKGDQGTEFIQQPGGPANDVKLAPLGVDFDIAQGIQFLVEAQRVKCKKQIVQPFHLDA